MSSVSCELCREDGAFREAAAYAVTLEVPNMDSGLGDPLGMTNPR